MLDRNIWNYSNVCKQISFGLFKKLSTNYLFTNHMHFIYRYKQDLAWNNLQGLICHKTQSTNKDINELWLEHSFSSKLIPLVFNTLIPVSFQLVKALLNLFFWYRIKFHCCISFNIPYFIKSLLWKEFWVKVTKKTCPNLYLFNMEHPAFHWKLQIEKCWNC